MDNAKVIELYRKSDTRLSKQAVYRDIAIQLKLFDERGLPRSEAIRSILRRHYKPDLDEFIDDKIVKSRVLFEKLKKNKEYISILYITDIHYPRHDPYALELTYKLVELIKPDLLTHFSDFFDFEALSRHEKDTDIFKRIYNSNPLSLIEFNNQYLDTIKQLSPSSLHVVQLGNHDLWLHNYLHKNSVILANYTLQAWYKDLLKDNVLLFNLDGRAIHLFDNLTLVHNAIDSAKDVHKVAVSQLANYANQVSVVSGHFHAFAKYGVQGIKRYVMSAVVACLMQQPSYYTNKTLNHEQGVGLIHYDLKTDLPSFVEIKYHSTTSEMFCFYNNERVSVKRAK